MKASGGGCGRSSSEWGPSDLFGGVASTSHSCLMIKDDWRRLIYIYPEELLSVTVGWKDFVYSMWSILASVLISEICYNFPRLSCIGIKVILAS